MIFIYILELENKKYYVGKTLDPNFGLQKNFKIDIFSEWTKKYKPKKLLKFIPNCDNIDEDNYTLKYMGLYGINNVRSGCFSELKLNKDKLNTIKKDINGIIGKCYICGENGHSEKDCSNDSDNILEELFKDNITTDENDLFCRFLICKMYVSYYDFKQYFLKS
jgi:hypothetical protein